MGINIDRITVKDRIRKEVTKIDELAADIAENGLLNPVTVMALSGGNGGNGGNGTNDGNGNSGGEYQLLAGLRRLRAAQSLGWTEIMVNVVTPADAEQALRMEISENEQREEFTFSEKMEFARLLTDIERAKSKERMSAGGKGGLTEMEGVPQGAPLPTGRTREIVASKIGMKKTTFERAKYVAENAPQEVIDELDKGERSIRNAFDELKAKEKTEKAPSEPSKPVTLPRREQPVEVVTPTLPAKTEKIDDVDGTVVVVDAADVENAEPEDPLAEETVNTEMEVSTPTIPTAPNEPTFEKPKKPTAAQRREERQMASMSPRDRAAILSRKAFDEMTDKEKIADLSRRLDDERFRADKAEQEVVRLKELLHNATTHRDDTIRNQQGQIEGLTAENARLEAALKAAKSKIAESEGRTTDV